MNESSPKGATFTAAPVIPLRRNGRVIAASLHVTIHNKPMVLYASTHSGVRVVNYGNGERTLELLNWAELSLEELRDAAERQLKPGDL